MIFEASNIFYFNEFLLIFEILYLKYIDWPVKKPRITFGALIKTP
jgi:hypothetical protein